MSAECPLRAPSDEPDRTPRFAMELLVPSAVNRLLEFRGTAENSPTGTGRRGELGRLRLADDEKPAAFRLHHCGSRLDSLLRGADPLSSIAASTTSRSRAWPRRCRRACPRRGLRGPRLGRRSARGLSTPSVAARSAAGRLPRQAIPLANPGYGSKTAIVSHASSDGAIDMEFGSRASGDRHDDGVPGLLRPCGVRGAHRESDSDRSNRLRICPDMLSNADSGSRCDQGERMVRE